MDAEIRDNMIIDKLNVMYHDDGATPEFMNYVNRLLVEKGSTGIKILRELNAVKDFELPDELLLKIYDLKSFDELVELVAKSNSIKVIYRFAYAHQDKNLGKLTDAICKSENLEYITLLASLGLKGIDIEKLTDVVIESGSLGWLLRLTDAKNVNIEKIIDAVCKSKSGYYIYHFAKDVKGANIKKLTDAICGTKSAEDIYNFAKDIKGADIEKLTDGICETGYPEYIYLFARDIKGSNIEKLTDALCNVQITFNCSAHNKAYYIYLFARDIKGVDTEKLQDAVCETGAAEYICAFAENIEGADINKLTDAILVTEDITYIQRFAQNVKGADLEKIARKICKTDYLGSICNFAMTTKGVSLDIVTDYLSKILIKAPKFIYVAADFWDYVKFLKVNDLGNFNKITDAILRSNHDEFIERLIKINKIAEREKAESLESLIDNI